MKYNKRAGRGFLACILAATLAVPETALAVTSQDAEDAREQVSSMEDEMEKVQQTLTDLEGLKNDTAAYVRELDLSLEQLGAELSSLEEQQMPGCPPEKGAEVILRFICRLSDREKATVSVRGSVEKVYEREEKGDEICRQFPGGWPVWKICGITMRGRTICSL